MSLDDFIMTNRENIEEKIWDVYSMIRDESRTDKTRLPTIKSDDPEPVS